MVFRLKITGLLLHCACFFTLLFAAQGAPAQQKTIQFTDITKAAGIHFTHFKGNNGISINLEEFGPGVCVSDYDGDGWQDIYFVNTRDRYGRGIQVQNALYHNNGDGTFTDVTDKAGVPGTGFGLGCVWGDYDNDGHPDLFVTQYGRNVLYHNNGDGTFTDVTDKAGVAGMDFGTYFHSGAVFFDYDRDGKLDLYVGSYVAFPPDAQRYCKLAGQVESSCPPSAYPGSPSILYHNNGDGTFTNVTKKAGIYQPNGKNLAVGAGDYDNDGWPDLFVANDGISAYLFHNERNGTFKEEGAMTGMAFTGAGLTMAAMCISLGDYNNDGWLDLFISDFQGNSDHLWKNDGRGYFDEVSDGVGLTVPTRNVLSFGGGFFDYDNDGWLDLFIANGHVYPEIEQILPEVHYKQINSLFHNNGHGKFIEVTKSAGEGFTVPHVGRGVAFADFDNDGFMDVVVANNNDPPLLLHNGGGNGNHFVSFKLIGTKSNRDAIGTRVKITAGGVSQIREVQSGGSYMSQNDLRAHFGLADASKIDRLEISWPSGLKQTFSNFPADQFYRIEEGKDELGYQPFVKSSKGKSPTTDATKSAPARSSP
ncbi:MAG TPA: CRTAC1 family protein [Candidatus Sulfotelmatobacter sp.]|nr:CRTAC1 family protein [Candidatus Sulfotelmatobacter sp.]